jgi:hypothetical protein
MIAVRMLLQVVTGLIGVERGFKQNERAGAGTARPVWSLDILPG